MRPRPRRYATGIPEIDDELDRLVERAVPDGEGREYVRQIAVTALKLGLDRAKRVDLKIANAALKEMRYAFKVFTPYRRVPKVTVFGSARTEPADPDYRRAVELGRRMAESGWMVVTGAGSGIMGAAHEGAGREKSFGVNIRLPFEQRANKVIRGDRKLLTFRYFFTRKLFLLKESSAVALFAGGFGTMDETFEVLTLLQTGKQPPIPVVMVESPETGYFADLAAFVDRQMIRRGLIGPRDRRLYRIVDSPSAAVEEILGFYRVYHSSRYVGDRLLLRLRRPLAPDELGRLNNEFEDILRSGRIEPAPPLPEEADDAELAALARVQLDFNRRDFARLRELIDAINAFG